MFDLYMRRFFSHTFFTVILLMMGNCKLHGQHIGRYHFEAFDLAHKAGVPGVYKMFQDTTGVIWLGSTNGIYRYDGTRIFEFDPSQKRSLGKTNYSFLQATNGDVIIGSDYGICRYHIQTNQVELLYHLNKVFNERSQCYPICFDKRGRLWFVVTGNGVAVYDGKSINWLESSKSFKAEFKIRDAFYDPKSGMAYLTHYLNHQAGLLNVNTGEFSIDTSNYTTTFVSTPSRLFKINGVNISVEDVTSGLITTFSPTNQNAFSSNLLYSKAVIIDDEWVWVSLLNGILPFHYPSGRFGQVIGIEGDSKSPLLRHISEIFVDKEGNVWICTETNGIKRLNRHNHHTFWSLSDVNNSNNIVMDIEPVNDSLLLVCPLVDSPRLVNINSNEHKKLLPSYKNSLGSFTSVRMDENIIFISNQNEHVYAFNTTTFRVSRQPTPMHSVRKIIPTRNPGELLIINSNHLYSCSYREGKIIAKKSIPCSFLSQNIIYNPITHLLYCNSPDGLTLIDAQALTILNKGKPYIGSFFDYYWGKDTTLWLATRFGLQHYDKNNRLRESYNTTNGMNNDVVYAILPNLDTSRLYLSTNLGISCLHLDSRKIENFTVDDGMLESEHNGGAAGRDTKGNLYFGNIKGVTVINNRVMNHLAPKPFLILQNILVDDSVYNPQHNPSFINRIDLYPKNHQLEIGASLLSSSTPAKRTLFYKTEGIDKNFHRLNSSFINIRIPKPWPGRYTVIIKGTVAGGSWVEKKILLVVHSPFYLKWWFLVPVILLFHTLLFFLIRQIIRNRLRKKQQEMDSERLLFEQKTQIARELHDNVGARLSMMLNTVDWIGKKPNIEHSDLGEIRENTQAVIQGLRDAIWVMDKTQVSSEELFDKIKYYTNQVTRSYPVEVTFNEVAHQEIILTTKQALSLFRILQESLNNALKYAQSNHIEISLTYPTEGGISLRIKDNGIGFDSSNRVAGHGIRNMQVRAAEVGARFELQSNASQGTEITVTLYIV